jgi:hypothetical protein
MLQAIDRFISSLSEADPPPPERRAEAATQLGRINLTSHSVEYRLIVRTNGRFDTTPQYQTLPETPTAPVKSQTYLDAGASAKIDSLGIRRVLGVAQPANARLTAAVSGGGGVATG